MIPDLRNAYNAQFSEQAYQDMLDWIANEYNYRPKFHIAETPVFLPGPLLEKLQAASKDVMAVISAPGFAERAAGALLPGQQVPGRTPNPIFLQMDFGLCLAEDGSVIPQLIEAQGFPSLYFFQDLLSEAYRKFFQIPEEYTSLFNGMDKAAYRHLLAECVLGGEDPANVILLEVDPTQQTTRIDFLVAAHHLGIAEVCISDLILEGKELFYLRNGQKTKVKRIFSRVIFDELLQRDDLKRQYNMIEEVDVSWAGHPDWFFMISKHTLPAFDSPYVPKSFFLSDLQAYPDDLDQYVLKPLYSFAGSG
ncbi:MAG: hypothetical protein AAFU67_06215, partial [Bacteroidota bacterium]